MGYYEAEDIGITKDNIQLWEAWARVLEKVLEKDE